MYRPSWAHGLSIIQYFVKRIKSLGEYGRRSLMKAKIDKGKLYDKQREPIIIYIFVSSVEQLEVETYLAQNRVYEYCGLFVFPIVDFCQ